MTRERLLWALGLLALLLGGWWLSLNTEWVDETRPRPMQGEARRNPVYAAEQVLRRLGMQVSHHESLERLPPPAARLVMLSSDWRLHAGLSERLKTWVQQGGQLVLTESSDWDEGPLADWVPMVRARVRTKPRAKPESVPSEPETEEPLARAEPDRTLLVTAPVLWEGEERLSVCGYFHHRSLAPREAGDAAALWSLSRVPEQSEDEAGDPSEGPTVALRLPFGRGSVTALSAGGHLLQFGAVLRCDNPLLLAALVQAEPGAEVWFYLHEDREALLPWLWNQAWVAIALGLLALAAAIWRALPRFGPRQASLVRPRRSMGEQVRGLAAFLNKGGRDALLLAQQRALREAALRRLRHLPSFRQPTRHNLAERVQAIAQATGLPADALAEAMTAQFVSRTTLPRLLQLLETARRRLLNPSSPESPTTP